jgi:hypothetical protein
MIFYDTETCGYHGPITLLQWAEDDGPINLWNPWYNTAKDTMQLIESIIKHPGGVCGFNLSFDHFHLCQMYTTLTLLPPSAYLEEIIDDYAIAEKKARDGVCLKPVAACDLLLWARKSKFQTLMAREDIRIKRVPTPLAVPLQRELEKRIHLDPIYFAKRKDQARSQWQIFDVKDSEGDVIDEFKDIVMMFNPSMALKSLAVHALKIPAEDVLTFGSVEVDKRWLPNELGYAPFALAIGTPGEWNGAWPQVIDQHVSHWENNPTARRYATADVDYTRRLYDYFGRPEPGDDDSELACMVGACRWRGYKINLDGVRQLKADAKARIGDTPTYTEAVKRWIDPLLDPAEALATKGSTKKVLLKEMTGLKADCPECAGEGKVNAVTKLDKVDFFGQEATPFLDVNVITCPRCKGTGEIAHPAGVRAKAVLDAREAIKEIELYDKLLVAGRLHADFNVIGTLSSRMSGSGGLNVQGINKTGKVRSQFDLAFSPYVLCGGDFSSFEVVLAIAVWGDKKLEETVQSFRPCHKCDATGQTNICDECEGKKVIKKGDSKILCGRCAGTGELPVKTKCFFCKGKGQAKIKIHALFGTYIYPDMTYEQIVDSDGSEDDRYTKSKSGLFAMMYGGEAYTLADRLGVDIESAERGYQRFVADFPTVGEARRKIFSAFAALKQEGGLGSRIAWTEPTDYIEEPILGHRRYFTLENDIIRALYALANHPPKEWRDIKITTLRRERVQTVAGAVQSALYGCAFKLQGENCRAAANHVIQSAGAKITKRVQRAIWDLQPSGIEPFVVQPMNVHDELLTPTLPDAVATVTNTVKEAVESFRDRVPLLAIDWKEGMRDWSAKK